MATPFVRDSKLVFSLDDPTGSFARVALDCDDAIAGRRRFRRTTAGWTLTIPRPPLWRVEYRLLLTGHDGSVEVVCDPANPERVRTAFGERSVALLPGYRPPAWLGQERAAAPVTRLEHSSDVLGKLPIDVWSPDALQPDDPAPLLVVHDGPEYADLAELAAYSAVMVGDQTLPRYRMALLHPLERDAWYTANQDYLRAELDALDTVRRSFAVAGPLVAMGASLGGLSALLVALAGEHRFGGVLSQSGSFFTSELDIQESSYPYFDRVVGAVRDIGRAGRTDHPLEISLTCGASEENYANNKEMATTLRHNGHEVRLQGVRDLHNYTAWRDSLHPALTDVLRSVWGAGG
jgi:enterochelin esterase family protein